MLVGAFNRSGLLTHRAERAAGALAMTSLARLATGQRINRAADDASGLIASESLRATLTALDAETRAIQRTNAVATVAGSALQDAATLLHEGSALALASANGAGLSDVERAANQLQLDSVISAVDRVFQSTTFAGRSLFDGSITLSAMSETVELPALSSESLGASEIDGRTVAIHDLRAGGAADLATDPEGAQQVLRRALGAVSTLHGRIGSFQRETLHARLDGLGIARRSVTAADADIRDADFALESASLLRTGLMQRAGRQAQIQAGRGLEHLLDLLRPEKGAA